MKKILLLAIIAAAVIAAYSLLSGKENAQAPVGEKSLGTETLTMEEESGNTYAVNATNAAFNPAILKIKVGDKVVFTNNDSSDIRISSGPHPTHTSYPNFESGQLAPKASYEFTATEKTTIKYHNHLNASATGQIIAE